MVALEGQPLPKGSGRIKLRIWGLELRGSGSLEAE